MSHKLSVAKAGVASKSDSTAFVKTEVFGMPFEVTRR
jgi:hypothetical protein